MNKIEKVYIGLSILPLLLTEIIKRGWFFPEVTLGHNAIWETAVNFLILTVVMGIWGIILIFRAKKRQVKYWPLVLATLLAVGPGAYGWGLFLGIIIIRLFQQFVGIKI